jgi:hypothetical protein
MNCANHPDVAVSQYCRTCGKPLCAACVRNVQGVAYCEQCLAERLGAVQPPQASVPYVAPAVYPAQPVAVSGPNPALAGILSGFFPFGVGAVYNGQYSKGLAQLVIMTLLIWGETAVDNGGLNAALGFGIAFFYVYQIIDAVKSAHAIRAGLPAPDPFGLTSMFGGWESKSQAAANAEVGMGAAAGTQAGTTYSQPRIPTAAVILIALGCLFLLRTAGIFDYDEDLIWPIMLIGLGAFMLIRRSNLPANAVDRWGRPVRRGLIGPTVLATIGTLILIEHLHGPSFHRTWPLLLLIIGLVRLLESKNPNSWSAGYAAPPPASMPPGTQTGVGSSPGSSSAPGNEVNRG